MSYWENGHLLPAQASTASTHTRRAAPRQPPCGRGNRGRDHRREVAGGGVHLRFHLVPRLRLITPSRTPTAPRPPRPARAGRESRPHQPRKWPAGSQRRQGGALSRHWPELRAAAWLSLTTSCRTTVRRSRGRQARRGRTKTSRRRILAWRLESSARRRRSWVACPCASRSASSYYWPRFPTISCNLSRTGWLIWRIGWSGQPRLGGRY